MGTITILPETTKNPITLIGKCAGICWGADTSDDAKNYKRGWDCITSGHGRTTEFPDVYMTLEGYSARVIREWYTHIGCLPSRLQASTRYINYNDFDCIKPYSIESNHRASIVYDTALSAIRTALLDLEKLGIPREDSALLLPLGMETMMIDKRNLRNLIDMSRQRLCMRAFWEFRELFGDIIVALNNYSDEWQRITTELFQPKCEVLGYCPEKNGCGMYPKKGEA